MKKILDPRAKTEANCGPSKKARQVNQFERGYARFLES
jgi:hypothetical protein